MLKAVVLAGGSGTRLWPKSQSHYPKQFISLLDHESMLQKTVKRLSKFISPEDIHIVTLSQYADYVCEQVQLPRRQMMIEPENRDTAACIGLSAMHFLRQGLDPVLITIPADHYIADEQAFQDALLQAYRQARREPCIVTLGIKPTRPETGYGYIKVAAGGAKGMLPVERFTEKPDLPTAQLWYTAPDYYWNSGIFVWRASVIRDLIGEHMPHLAEGLRKIGQALGTDRESEVLRAEYGRLEKQSIDVGVLEKARRLYMLPVSFGWDDLGSWSALARITEPDANGNIVVGRHRLVDTHNCIVYSDRQSVAAIGLDNLIIAVTDGVIMISPKDREQEIRTFSLKSEEGQ